MGAAVGSSDKPWRTIDTFFCCGRGLVQTETRWVSCSWAGRTRLVRHVVDAFIMNSLMFSAVPL